jgi:NhaA family Na+:H+ antiporter
MPVYVAAGIVAWLAMYKSGVHPTIAGVVLGLLTPATPYYDEEQLEDTATGYVGEFQRGRAAATREGDQQALGALRALEDLSRDSRAPLGRLEHALHPWTSYAVIPIFALANAGVALDADALSSAARSPVTAGVALGLMLGKPLGILLFSGLAVRLGLAALPSDVRWAQVAGVAIVAGIGFTVSLFIGGLAFADPALVDDAKIGILVGSAVMGAAGFLMLRAGSRTRREPAQAAERPDS